jgi:hypothetical protein
VVSCSQISVVLKGITQSFIREHGAKTLLSHRRKPLGPDLLRRLLSVPSGPSLGSRKLDWSLPLFLCLGCMLTLGGASSFFKSEVALPAHTFFNDRRLSRSSALWLTDGALLAGPPAALLLSLVPSRDFAVVKTRAQKPTKTAPSPAS